MVSNGFNVKNLKCENSQKALLEAYHAKKNDWDTCDLNIFVAVIFGIKIVATKKTKNTI